MGEERAGRTGARSESRMSVSRKDAADGMAGRNYVGEDLRPGWFSRLRPGMSQRRRAEAELRVRKLPNCSV